MKTKRLPLIFITIILLSTPAILRSAENLSLNALIDEALKNNPQIKAAKFRAEAAKSRVKLLRTLDDPKFEYEYDKIIPSMISGATGMSMSPMRTFSISQDVPFPTKLLLRKQAAEKESRAYEQEYKETERKVIQNLKNAYFELFLSHKKIAITQENLNLISQFIEVANKKYSVGQATQADSLKAQVEHSKLSNELVLLSQEEKIAESMINALLSRPQDALMGEPQEKSNKDLEFNEDKIIKLTKESRPELKSFKEMMRKSEIDYALSKQEYLPDFMFKYKREQKNGSAGAWAGSIGMTIPLWFWEKQNSFVKEARANNEVVKAEYKQEENMVLFEARSALVKFEAAKNLVKIYETGVLPQAQAALDTAVLGYQAGKLEFLELLDSQRSLREFQMEYFQAQADLEIALADLERSVGTDLSK